MNSSENVTLQESTRQDTHMDVWRFITYRTFCLHVASQTRPILFLSIDRFQYSVPILKAISAEEWKVQARRGGFSWVELSWNNFISGLHKRTGPMISAPPSTDSNKNEKGKKKGSQVLFIQYVFYCGVILSPLGWFWIPFSSLLECMQDMGWSTNPITSRERENMDF